MRNALALLVTVLFLSGCAHKKYTRQLPSPPASPSSPTVGAPASRPAVPSPPPPATAPATAPVPAPGYRETGVASWYGHPYHGRPAADGEIYDMEQMVAAHRTLPFDTWVRVYDLDNNKDVEVRIIDRGPFIDGRIIDLSHAAAQAIALIGPGIANVRLEVIHTPDNVPPAVFAVQIGAFRDPQSAERVRAQMAARYGTARLVERAEKPGVWRVMVGAEPTPDAARALSSRIRKESGERNAFVVRLDSE
ncbi:MAG: septal ring lytic transglycosylase RlpA family protein [Bryobacteraceae bacterium]|jgi:rare lipoprotein A